MSSISICTIIPYVCPGPNGGGEGGGGDGGGGDGGGGVGGGGMGGGGGDIGGNGGGKIRGPQSVQSCPNSQALYPEFAPPSSQYEFSATMQSFKHTKLLLNCTATFVNNNK